MKARVYLETSIVSYLVARLSRDLIVAARQRLTQDWWLFRRPALEAYASQLVVAEAAAGDSEMAARRLALLSDLPLLDVSPDAVRLADHLVRRTGLPPDAGADALHIAVATVHGMDYLLTWNSNHIANAARRPRVERACREQGFEPPVLCTPDELMGDD